MCPDVFNKKNWNMFVTACTAVQLNDISDFFGWNFFSFKSAWIFSCAFQFSSKTFSCTFSLKCSCFVFLRSLCTLRYFVLVSLGNKVQTSQKIKGNVLLLNWKAHAKIQALLKEKKIHLKNSLTSVLHQAIQL